MSRRPRRNHQPAFKAKVALEAAKEEMTTSELALRNMMSHPAILPTARSNYWSEPLRCLRKALHAKIGQLTLENDFLEGTLTKAVLLSAKR